MISVISGLTSDVQRTRLTSARLHERQLSFIYKQAVLVTCTSCDLLAALAGVLPCDNIVERKRGPAAWGQEVCARAPVQGHAAHSHAAAPAAIRARVGVVYELRDLRGVLCNPVVHCSLLGRDVDRRQQNGGAEYHRAYRTAVVHPDDLVDEDRRELADDPDEGERGRGDRLAQLEAAEGEGKPGKARHTHRERAHSGEWGRARREAEELVPPADGTARHNEA